MEFYANGFSGHSSAWFEEQNLVKVSRDFEQYPIMVESPPTIEGGYWKDGTLSQELLHFSAHPIGSCGAIIMKIRILSNSNPECYAGADIKTVYEDIARFAQNLRPLLKGSIQELILVESDT